MAKDYDMSEVVDFGDNLLDTPLKDIDKRLAKVDLEILRKLAKNIIIKHQVLRKAFVKNREELEKLRYYANRLENLLTRSSAPKTDLEAL